MAPVRPIAAIVISSLLLLFLADAQRLRADPPGAAVPPIAPFSSARAGGDFPDAWAPLTFDKIPRHTRYSLVDEGGRVVVEARSAAAASGLIHEVALDPRRLPIIRWRWKVDHVYRKGDVTRKSGDDYAARIYVTFRYDPDNAGFFEKATFEAARLVYGKYPPMGAISYIWASRAPRGGRYPNPYTDKVAMIVVRSGAADAGKWHTETRNLLADYRAAFGKEPPEISGIAIMTDSDNTGESGLAYYGDIELLSAEALEGRGSKGKGTRTNTD